MGAEEEVLVTLSGGAPWGFRLHGGAEQRKPLQVSKVRESPNLSLLRFQGKGNPREPGKSHVAAYGGDVGGCEAWWSGKHAYLVGRVVSEDRLLCGAIRKGNS